MIYSDREVAELESVAPRFDSIAHAVYWLRWRMRLNEHLVTTCHMESGIGYMRQTEHVAIHLAAIYALAEALYRAQNIEGV